jgi:predicted permease
MRPRDVKRLFGFPSRNGDDVRDAIQEEFGFHLDMRTEELMRSGLDRDASREQALREFGNRRVALSGCAVQDDTVERQRRLGRLALELRQDATLGLRMLARSPGFAAVAILTLALGIGATAAIFSTLDAVLLRPLPYPHPEQLVQVLEVGDRGTPNSVAGGVFLDWQAHQTQFDSLALVGPISANLRSGGLPERVIGLEVSHDFVRVLGIRLLLGSGFLPEHDRPGGNSNVVLLTEELWRTRFGSDPSIVGTSVVMDEVPRTVIGVVPRGAWIFRDAQVFVPAVLAPGTARSRRAPHWAEVYGRLKAGTTAARGDADLKAVKRQLATEYPAFKQRWSVMVRPLHDVLSVDRRPVVLTLLGAVALLLLIACANVANLLLARACNREQEMALRAALGATKARIVRQVLTEGALLAFLGGAAGILLSSWAVGILGRLMTDLMPQAMTPQLDMRVLAFAVVTTGVTALLFGMLPAWRAGQPDVNGVLKNGGKSATAGGRRGTQAILVIAEVALTVVLLTSAGLLLRSLANVARVDPGFEPARALAFELSLPKVTYPTAERRLAFSADLLGRIRRLPGVDAAGAGMSLPFRGGGFGEYLSRPDRPGDDFLLGRVDYVSEGYLEALGTRLLAGRRLIAADNLGDGLRVAVISNTTARTFFPAEDPIGRELFIVGNKWRVVGVVADVVDRRLDLTPRPFAYLPQAYNPFDFSIVVRTPLDPMSMAASIKHVLLETDPGVASANVRTLDQAGAASMAQQRLTLNLVGTFSAAALTLACIGLYGVMAYSVATRRREICIRMALGAVSGDVIRDVLGDGLRLMSIGVVVGLMAAIAAGRLLTSQLYHVGSADPTVIGETVFVMTLVALVACLMPAWSAARSNPIAALRND